MARLLNYEAATSHNITVRVTDQGGLTFDKTFAISLTNVNEAPTNATLTNSTVAENAANGTAVGTVAGVDPDAGATFSYSLTDSAGGRFAINSSTGAVTVANGGLLNYEAATSHNITVRVTDQGGLTFDKTFTIGLTNVNEAPTNATLSGGSVAENAANGTAVGTVAGVDPDAGATFSYSLTDSAGGRFAINSSTGAVTVANGGLLNYEAAASHNITVRVTDQGGLTFDKTLAIALANVNEAPVNTVPGAKSFSANTWSYVFGLSIADVDAGAGSMTTTVSVGNGVLYSGGAGVSGNLTGTLVLTGSLSQINNSLGILQYRGNTDYFGADTLTMSTNDNGNSGSGGAKSDVDYLGISLGTIVTGTGGDETIWATNGAVQRIDALGGGSDTLVLPFRLVDASINWSNNHIIIDGPSGSHYVVNGFETYSFTDGTVYNNDGNTTIDDLFYYARNHDVWTTGWSAEDHYNINGWHEGRNPNPFFSTNYYLSVYGDIAAAGVNPLDHYNASGWQEGRNPSAGFNTNAYRSANPDVGGNPLSHYLYFGMNEGRSPVATGLPIILDLDGDGVEITPLTFSAAHFDMNNLAGRERTAWVGPDDGLLAIDLAADGGGGPDGNIDQTKEIVFAAWAPGATSDMAAVRQVFDTNGNGTLDAGDARWSEFRVWRDANGDGVSQSGEVKTLDQLDIASIDLTPAGSARTLDDGSVIGGVSTYTHKDGTTGAAGDVSLAFDSASGGDLSTMMQGDRHSMFGAHNAILPSSGNGNSGLELDTALLQLIQAMAVHSGLHGAVESNSAAHAHSADQQVVLAQPLHQ